MLASLQLKISMPTAASSIIQLGCCTETILKNAIRISRSFRRSFPTSVRARWVP